MPPAQRPGRRAANSPTPSRIRRDREKAATRALILEAARDLFTREGYAETSMRRLADAIHGLAQGVALTIATQVDEILRMADAVEPDIIHISTDPEAVGIEAMSELIKRLPPSMKLMKAIPIEGDETLELAMRFAAVSDFLLLDTKTRGLPGVVLPAKSLQA